MDEQRLKKLRGFSHPLIALTVAFLFVWIVDSVLRMTILPLVFRPLPQISLVVAFVAALESLIATNRLEQARISALAARIREVVALLIVVTAATMLIGGYPQAGDFNPVKIDVIYAIAVSLLTWFLVVHLHSKLKHRERFLSLLVGKDSRAALQETARDAATEAGESDSAVRTVRRMAIIYAAIGVVFYLFVGATTTADPAALLRLIVAQLVITALTVLTCSGYALEEDALVNGATGSGSMIRRRLLTVVVLTTIVAAFSLAVAGRDAIIPPQRVVAFMERVSQRDTYNPDRRFDPTSLFSRTGSGQAEDTFERDADYGQAIERSDTAARALRAVGIAVGAAIAAGFLYFLIAPIFSRDMRERIKAFSLRRLGQRIASALRNGWHGVVFSVRGFFQSTGTAVARAREAVREVRERVAERREHARSRRQSDEPKVAGKLVKSFVRVAKWGGAAGVPYHRWMGPLAYTQTLASHIPDHAEAIIAVGTQFEELVYGPTEPSNDQIAALAQAVGELTRNRVPTAGERRGA